MTVTFVVVALTLLVPMIAYGELPDMPDFPALLAARMDGHRSSP